MATASQSPEPQPPQPADSPAESAPPPDSTPADSSPTEPTLADRHRHWAASAGQSIAEIAKQEGVPESEILLSIQRVRNDNEQYSSAWAGIETRKLYIQTLPKINSAIGEALSATKLHGKKVVMIDKETGDAVTMEETVERPDHDVRLRAIDGVRYLLSVVQPKDPAVQITSNSQTNILNQAPQVAAGAGGHAGLTSPEAVIRAIVTARQHSLTSGNPASQPATLEGEPVMDRSTEELPDDDQVPVDDDDNDDEEYDEESEDEEEEADDEEE